MNKKNLLLWIVPALFLLLIAPFTPELDLRISSFYFQDGEFQSNKLADFFYFYGFYTADILGIVSLLALLFSAIAPCLKPYRAAAALFLFTLVVGSGLMIHVILKDHWGRPRPVQIKEFGGQESYKPFYSPDIRLTQKFKSFPSGHGSVGFCFFALVIVGWRQNNKCIFYLGIFLTLFLGISLSYARIAQGGHFFSDTLVSALIMYWTALAGGWLIYDKLS